MKYDFDTVIDRKGSYSMKWELDKLGTIMGVEAAAISDETIPMMTADMDLQSPEPVIQAMHRVADHKIYGYSSQQADESYATSLCRWFKDRHDWQIQPQQVICSHGTFGALTHVAHMMAKPGEGIIVMDPVYGHFAQDIEKWGNRVIRCHLINQQGYYTINYELLEQQAADPNTKLLIFCNPHNPVGRVWTAEEISRVARICEQNGVFVISDEVHCDHLRKGVRYTPFLKVCSNKANAICLVGINKSFNMAGLSCSNAIVQDQQLYNRIMAEYPFTMPSPFAIAGQIAAYTEGDEWMDQVCQYIEENIDFALDLFAKEMPKLKIWKPEGTYCLWMDFRDYGLTDAQIHKRIYEDAKVLLQDGAVHDPVEGACFQRMCLPCARSVLETACRRIIWAFRDVNGIPKE